MLTKLHDLRDIGKIIFIVATNYAERIDPAIKREGRLDRTLLLLPPDRDGRKKIIRDILKIQTNYDSEIEKAADITKLWTWKELDSVRKEVDSIEDPKKRIDKFTENLKNKNPNIKTETYFSRFFLNNSGNSGIKSHKEIDKTPWGEFLSLLVIKFGLEDKIDKQKFKVLAENRVRYNQILERKEYGISQFFKGKNHSTTSCIDYSNFEESVRHTLESECKKNE
jgi:hypothetical protein